MNQEIVTILSSTPSPKQLAQSIDSLRRFDESELFDTLFCLGTRPQGNGLPVAYAAFALQALNPKCTITPIQALKAMLPGWDVSIEEIVFYLMQQFGIEAMRSAKHEIERTSQLAEIEKKRLETIRYWGSIWLTKGHAP
ncbi:hypothetical protein [Massilia putida]|uniref:hypothetical protein n=1 Tax=Massilia putida TaxID=1141883 RepID=UPI0009523249|nr:hypothetical protein [Massilia putida]